ncbi:MAG: Tfp pilus assembly protein PilN [Candidatus Omnitrophota bacterium]|jgi:Tfp pilus assembly protein PilN
MIQVDLTPQEYRYIKPGSNLPPFVSPKNVIRLWVIIFIIQMILVLMNNFYLSPKQEASRQAIVSIGKPLGEVRKIKTETSDLQARVRLLEGGVNKPLYWTQILNEISEAIVSQVWLNHIQLKQNIFDLSMEEATARAQASVTRLDPVPVVKRYLTEKRLTIALSGQSINPDQGTAIVGRFIDSLKSQPILKKVTSDIVLDKVKKVRSGTHQLLDFRIYCVFKPEYEQEYFDLIDHK